MPLQIGYFLWCIEDIDNLSQNAYMVSVTITISLLLISLVNNIFFYELQQMGMKIRIGLCSMMYRKVIIDY